MAAEQLDELWDGWIATLSKSYGETLISLDAGKIEEAGQEFTSQFCATVKNLYTECEKTYPSRFASAECWTDWVKDFYSLTAKSQSALKKKDRDEALQGHVAIRGHFYELRRQTDGLTPGDALFDCWRQSRDGDLASTSTVKAFLSLRQALADFDSGPSPDNSVVPFLEAAKRWGLKANPILEDGTIAPDEKETLCAVTDEFRREFGMRLDPFPLPAPPSQMNLAGSTVARFASREESAKILTDKADGFLEAMSPFDRALRMKADRDIPEEEYLDFLRENAMDWDWDSMRPVVRALDRAKECLTARNLPFPKEILLIHTTGKEEFNSPHTRLNAIVVPSGFSRFDYATQKEVILHELFHILSRANPILRESLYSAIGFATCAEIVLPKALAARKITNPDGVENCVTSVTVDGAEVNVVPLLLSDVPAYDPQRGGSIFAYLKQKLMAVEKSDIEGRWSPILKDGEPVLYEVDEVSGLFDRTGGKNYQVIHPDEILAEAFVLLVSGKTGAESPDLLTKLSSILTKSKSAVTQAADKKSAAEDSAGCP